MFKDFIAHEAQDEWLYANTLGAIFSSSFLTQEANKIPDETQI